MRVIQYESGSLAHHGILGMKWGIRRFQNEDGSLTEVGKKRYARINEKIEKLESRRSDRLKKKEALVEDAKSNISNEKALSRRLANIEANDKFSSIEEKYKIARLKAKNDPDYKNSAEFDRLRTEYRAQLADNYFFGRRGTRAVYQLMNEGMSETKAMTIVKGSQVAGFILGYMGMKLIQNL